jgi:hypothetical protein
MRRIAIAAWLVVGPIVILFFGGQVGMCLGPLGLTVVGCVASTGVFPSDSISIRLLGAWLIGGGIVALTILRPERRTTLRIAAIAVVALPIGFAIYALTRPLTLEGPATLINGEPPGRYLVLPWPFDNWTAVGYALVSAGVVLAVAAIATFARARRDRSAS